MYALWRTVWLRTITKLSKIYDDIARQGVEPGSQDTGYFRQRAAVAGDLITRMGIPGSPVKANLGAARQLYFQAASAFGVPEAQYRSWPRVILEGHGRCE